MPNSWQHVQWCWLEGKLARRAIRPLQIIISSPLESIPVQALSRLAFWRAVTMLEQLLGKLGPDCSFLLTPRYKDCVNFSSWRFSFYNQKVIRLIYKQNSLVWSSGIRRRTIHRKQPNNLKLILPCRMTYSKLVSWLFAIIVNKHEIICKHRSRSESGVIIVVL